MKHPTRANPLTTPMRRLWRTARFIALVVTAVVLTGLVLRPEQTLTIAWYGIVPLLPASFLINAGLWRSVCPIATVNMYTGDRVGTRRLSGSALRGAAVIGIVLLIVLIPMRHLVLNQNGPVLAGTLAGIVTVAFVSGTRFNKKGGFCNSICPILPVEKLYGQSPLVYVRNPRCVPCSVCTKPGCFDVDPSRAVIEATRYGRRGQSWVLSTFGLFMAAFPGLILGYFQTPDMPMSQWPAAYGGVLIPGLVSLVVFGGAGLLLRIPGRIAAPVLGALSVGLYYWFAGPSSAEAFGWSVETGLALRWMFIALTSFWLAVALGRSTPVPSSRRARPRRAEPAELPNIH